MQIGIARQRLVDERLQDRVVCDRNGRRLAAGGAGRQANRTQADNHDERTTDG
jgi:hypothetical protein